MNNTKNILVFAIITATLVLGTSVIPMQSYADRGGNNDDRKKDNDYKSKTSASYESDKKSASQHQDQDNFCYRGDNDCEQANQGQQIVGKNNEAKGFNDQSDNLQLQAVTPTATQPPTQPPTPTCEECFKASLTIDRIAALIEQLNFSTTLCQGLLTLGISEELFREELRVNIGGGGVSEITITQLIECLKASGVVFRP